MNLPPQASKGRIVKVTKITDNFHGYFKLGMNLNCAYIRFRQTKNTREKTFKVISLLEF